MSTHTIPTIAVIGGGPAGLMAAEVMGDAGARVTVYECMPSVGRKFLIAGRGGLNVTHSEPYPAFLARYGAGSPQLRAALDAFPPDALRAWAGGLGQELFVGSSGRVFPRAWKASPLLRAWLARLAAAGTAIAVRHRWTGFGADGALRFETPDGPTTVRADAVVLALGGASWPRLGSDGSWAAILSAEGAAVAPLRPANCGLLFGWSERFRARFAGEPLKRVALSYGGISVRGDAVVTNRGLEGGAVYPLSAAVGAGGVAGGSPVLSVDLRPDLDAARLARSLGRPRGAQSASTFLRKAAGLSPVAVALLREASGRDLSSEPEALAALIKSVRLPIVGLDAMERAISSAGGLAWSELDDRFMLRRRPGLFAAGEMLDWDAPTGGHLLTASIATGRAAADGALRWLGERNAGDTSIRIPTFSC